MIDLETKLKSVKWKHPLTGNKVDFKSLPEKEQERIRAKYKGKAEEEKAAPKEPAKKEEEPSKSKAAPAESSEDIKEEMAEKTVAPKVEMSDNDQRLYDEEVLGKKHPKGSAKDRIQQALKKLNPNAQVKRWMLKRDLESEDKKYRAEKEQDDKAIEDALNNLKLEEELQEEFDKMGVEDPDIDDLKKIFEDVKMRKQFAEAFVEDAPPEIQKIGPPDFLGFMVEHLFDSMFEWVGKPEGYESAMDKRKRYEEYSSSFDKVKGEAGQTEEELKHVLENEKPEEPDDLKELRKLHEEAQAKLKALMDEGGSEKDIEAAKAAVAAAKKKLKPVEKKHLSNEKHWKEKVVGLKRKLNEQMYEMMDLSEDQKLGPAQQDARRKEREKEKAERKREREKGKLPFKSIEEMLRQISGEEPKVPEKVELKDPEATKIADKHKLISKDIKSLQDFQKENQASFAKKKLSDAERMKKFMEKASPDTKKRMSKMTPDEFKKMLGAIMEEGGGMKAAALERFWFRLGQDEDQGSSVASEFRSMLIKGLQNPSDEVVADTLESMSKAEATENLKKAWSKIGGAEHYFFDNPEKREVRQFAQSKALHNLTPEERAKGAPPTMVDIKRENPGNKVVSTLSRYLVETDEPVTGVPRGREDLPRHPKLAKFMKTWSNLGDTSHGS